MRNPQQQVEFVKLRQTEIQDLEKSTGLLHHSKIEGSADRDEFTLTKSVRIGDSKEADRFYSRDGEYITEFEGMKTEEQDFSHIFGDTPRTIEM